MTVIRMKTKLRESEVYRSVFFTELDLSREERVRKASPEAKRRENAEGEATGVNGSMAAEKRSLIVV